MVGCQTRWRRSGVFRTATFEHSHYRIHPAHYNYPHHAPLSSVSSILFANISRNECIPTLGPSVKLGEWTRCAVASLPILFANEQMGSIWKRCSNGLGWCCRRVVASRIVDHVHYVKASWPSYASNVTEIS